MGEIFKEKMKRSLADSSPKGKKSQQDRKEISERFKDPVDPLKFVIARDMWLIIMNFAAIALTCCLVAIQIPS